MIEKLKKGIGIALLLFGIDKAIPNLAYMTQDYNINNPKVQEVMHTKDYVFDYFGENQDVALKYLKLAHAVTIKNMDYMVTNSDISDDFILDTQFGDCVDFSRFTYSNYLFLLKESGKSDLAKHVRFVVGKVESDYGKDSHAWLEFNQSGKWIPYETTKDILSEEDMICSSNIDDLIPSEGILNYKGFKYIRRTTCHINSEGRNLRGIDLIGASRARGLCEIAWRGVIEYRN
jgi:hypothetical protein